jgi:hypothetical protein
MPFGQRAVSGLMMQGHLLSSHPSGNPLWNGGAVRLEGCLLVLPLPIVAAAGMSFGYGVSKKAAY